MSKRRLFAGFSILMLFLCCATNSLAQNDSSCLPSSCGDISIRYPFRLKDDPINCGHDESLFTLECKENRTILSSQSQHYIIQTINYDNFTMRVVDPGLDRDNYSSCPIYSWYDISSRNVYLSWVQTITIVNCLRPVNSSLYIENPFCGNKSAFSNLSEIYSYFVVGSVLVSELDESCTSDTVAQASPDVPLQENASYRAVHDFLSSGFELYWFNAMCGECDPNQGTCTFEDGQIRCRHYCFEHTPLSERTFLCKLEYYAPYIILIVLPVIGAIVLLRLLCVLPILIRQIARKWRRRNSSVDDDELIEEILKHDDNLMPIRYSYSEIKKMTKDFKDKLGEGSNGTVYKGKLRSGPLAAIKMTSDSIESGKEFIDRVARIGRIRHANVVKLIGFCIEGSKRALVYEFVTNGSLERYMYAQEGTISLTYKQMFGVSLGMARGIDYLHNASQHVDIKPRNILLDENFNPKVSHYNLDNTEIVSYKADVYSFGMMLMEMVQRRRNMNPFDESLSQVNFASWVYDRLDQKEGVDMKDATDEERKMMKKTMIVVLWCIQTRPEDRPSMSKVVEMLEDDNGDLRMPPKS